MPVFSAQHARQRALQDGNADDLLVSRSVRYCRLVVCSSSAGLMTYRFCRSWCRFGMRQARFVSVIGLW